MENELRRLQRFKIVVNFALLPVFPFWIFSKGHLNIRSKKAVEIQRVMQSRRRVPHFSRPLREVGFNDSNPLEVLISRLSLVNLGSGARRCPSQIHSSAESRGCPLTRTPIGRALIHESPQMIRDHRADRGAFLRS